MTHKNKRIKTQITRKFSIQFLQGFEKELFFSAKLETKSKKQRNTLTSEAGKTKNLKESIYH